MDNYSKVLEFFMENNIQLTSEQLEALKEEFLGESGGVVNRLINDTAKKASVIRKQAEKEYDAGNKNKAAYLGCEWDNVNTIMKPDYSTGYSDIEDMKMDPGSKFSREGRKEMKGWFGQGKENMPKDREPGEYLKKQEEKRNK